MKHLILLSLTIFISLGARASIPTVEGLFRNGDNPELTGDTVALNVTIEEIQAQALTEDSEMVQMQAPQMDEEQASKKVAQQSFYKLIFSVTKGQPLSMIQVRYTGPQLETNQVIDVKYYENLERTFAQETSFNRLLTFSLISMHGLNHSDGFNELLKRFARDYKPNSELVNQEKKKLYSKYKQHLSEKSEEASPLAPEDPEQLTMVKEVLKSRFYDNTKKAKLIRTNNEFLWEVNLDTVKAQFSHDQRMLKKMNVTNFNGEVQVDIGPYFAANGNFQLPSFILVKHSTGEEAKISFSGYQDFNSRNKRFTERVTDYEKYLQQNLPQLREQRALLPATEYMY